MGAEWRIRRTKPGQSIKLVEQLSMVTEEAGSMKTPVVESCTAEPVTAIETSLRTGVTARSLLLGLLLAAGLAALKWGGAPSCGMRTCASC